MDMPVGRSMCLMTPSYAGDIDQFSILRKSINLFAPGLPHLALIQTEDCRKFRERFGNETNLEIVPSCEVLPERVELHRRKSGPRWLTGKLRHGRLLIKGWHAQQLTKIFALASCGYDDAVFLDSDVFLCRPLDPRFFYVDGQLKLFRCRATNAESMDFDISTHDILGNPLHQIHQLYDFVFHPACFKRSTALRLLEEFKARKRSTWVRRFLAQRRPSEYNLLGYSATELECCVGYRLTECNPQSVHHSIRFPEDRGRLAQELENMQLEPKPFALIQSTLKLPFEQIAHVFEQIVTTQRAAKSSTAPIP